MNSLVGARPESLQELSRALGLAANHLRDMQNATSTALSALAWEGSVAHEFLLVWNTHERPRFLDAAAFLTGAAETLDRQAAEQTATSAAIGAGTEPESPDDAGEPVALSQSLADRLSSAGFLLDASQLALLTQIGKPAVVEWFLDNASLFRGLSALANGGTLITDFLADTVQNPQLPTDERLVHAIGEAALRYAADQGISQAMQWTGTAIAAAVTAGVGLLLGRAIGWAVGEALAAGFRYLDDKHDVTDVGADLVTQTYRNIRDNPEPYLQVVPVIGPAIPGAVQLWNTAADLMAEEPVDPDDSPREGQSPPTRPGVADQNTVDRALTTAAGAIGELPVPRSKSW